MNSIYRKSLEVLDYQEVSLTGPPLSVAADRDGRSDIFDLWFEYWDDQAPCPCPIYVLGTGHPAPWTRIDNPFYTFVGTVVTPLGLVWHIFTGPAI